MAVVQNKMDTIRENVSFSNTSLSSESNKQIQTYSSKTVKRNNKNILSHAAARAHKWYYLGNFDPNTSTEII